MEDLQAIKKVVGYAAYPVHVEIPAVEMQTTIETVEKRPLAADLFEVPADYREEPRPAFTLNPPEGSGISLLRRVRRGGRSAFSGGILTAALARVRAFGGNKMPN